MKNNSGGTYWEFIDPSKEACDLFIMNHVQKRDIVVKQEIGLASTHFYLKKFIFCLQRGFHTMRKIFIPRLI
ncbi:DUF188 domain-containing protein [Bacillus sp. DTU_2020_1000418_1_SI_GHA_SEK_038]|uniref:DUF188 domain-containing protein n=1 Tax=Bacillus sp. DTU_2020_1000418_1_SI_GHA_SEK_038 TaxID=3077585 RepID=UPI0028EDD01C|nr:DUF188 domain-containing protein [Bacillus sp. DTU_2020_1000418_1_SI_GHA_SEK_038]WNS77620.1 DUF188 domain-containing protein [Bacillus sp. DTU_2020_1000418_1_SI_GHA_SEK_038]